MFKIGDKITMRGFEGWGGGEIKEIRHTNYGDRYFIYFPNRGTSLITWSQDNFYQTLEQQMFSNLARLPKMLKTTVNSNVKYELENGSVICPIHDSDITYCRSSGWGLNVDYMFIDEFDNGRLSKTITTKGDENTMKNFGLSLEKNGAKIHINPKSEIIFKSNVQSDEAERIVKLLKEMFNKQPVILGNLEMGDVECNMFKMPEIVDYKYIEDTAVTTIKWSDGTRTTVRAEYPETASPYTGFVTACAKKAFGNNNTINKLFDEWAVKKPAREIKAKIKANAAELEAKRIAEKRKAKREKWLIRKRAAEINREYEARKLANEKYGVPMDKEDV